MPARDAKSRRPAPRAPDVPARLDAAPATLDSRDSVSWVSADESVTVADVVADASISESSWDGVDFSGRRMTGFRATDVIFTRCDFSATMLDGAELTRVRFSGCRLTGTALSGGRLHDVVVEDCAATLANLRFTQADRLVIERSSLRDADFYESRLEHTALVDCDLTQANFANTRAPGIELFGSTLDALRGADSLTDARIDAEQVMAMGAALVAALGITVADRS